MPSWCERNPLRNLLYCLAHNSRVNAHRTHNNKYFRPPIFAYVSGIIDQMCFQGSLTKISPMSSSPHTSSGIYTGRNLGRGSFCIVKEIFQSCSHAEPTYLALKQPRSDLNKDLQEQVRLDLRNELNILSDLKHKHIIQLCPSDIVCNYPEYLVMEKLHHTLKGKIKSWTIQKRNAMKLHQRLRGSRSILSNLWVDRLNVIHDIACAMKYLHSKNIILRDLKPDNCGFDADGNVKLFDFGLAVDCTKAEKVGIDQYLLEEGVGTPRYMSPEVANDSVYGKPCDVYSFALVAWEVIALEKPYATLTWDELHSRVYNQHHRPKVNKKWPALLQCLFHRSWYNNPRYRPQFPEIQSILAEVLDEYTIASKHN